MLKSILTVASLFTLSGMLPGCGSTTAPTLGGTPVAVTMHDSAPPTGVTVLAFSVTVSGMTLVDSGGNPENLMAAPVTVNFQQLLTQSTLLTYTAAPGDTTYDSMTMTFSNPSITILNASGHTITVGTDCASGQICTLTPTLNEVTITTSAIPFPLTITNTSIGLDVDLNLSSSLQGDFSVTPAVVVAQTTAMSGVLGSLNANGQITNVNGSSFTITDATTGNALTFITDSNTTFTNFNTNATNCRAPNTFACLAAHQNININYNIPQSLLPTNFQATSVILKNNITNGIEGTVVAAPTQGAPSQFTMVVTGFSPSRTGVAIGETLTVTSPSNPSVFAVLPVNGITIPSSLAFSGVSSTAVGQTIDIDSPGVSPTSGTPSTATITATAVLLVPSQFIGTLSAINGPNLTVNGLNSVFTTGGVNSLTANTQSGTQFLSAPLSRLVANLPITIGGEVFTGTNGITVVAGQVGQFFAAVPTP